MASLATAMKVQSSLASIGSPPVEASNVKGEDTDELVTGVANTWLISAAVFAFVSAGCAMFFTQMLIVDIASFTVLVLAPVAVAQKRKLNKLGGLRGQQNNLRMTVNSMASENTQLRNNVTEMENTIKNLKGVEQELQRIAKVSGGQADRLYDIVQENGKLQKKIQKNLESQVIQNVLQLALKNDRNMNFSFDQAELKRLKISMKQIPGITFDEKNFDGLIDDAKELALPDIMRMLRNFLSKETPESERIVHVTPEKLSKRRFFG